MLSKLNLLVINALFEFDLFIEVALSLGVYIIFMASGAGVI